MDIALLVNRSKSTPALPDATGSPATPDTTHDGKSPFLMDGKKPAQMAGQLCQAGQLCHDCADTSSPNKKWSDKEDEELIKFRDKGMTWEDVSKELPGRSAAGCRLRYRASELRHSYYMLSSAKTEEDTILDMGETEQLGTLEYLDTSGAVTVKPTIWARIGPFVMGTSETHFTCYRKNHITFTCSYSLTPCISDKPMQFTPTSTHTPIPVDQFVMCISAINSTRNEEVPLVQFNPMRDQSSSPKLHLLDPKPELQLGEYADDCQSQHTFHRIQFQSASAKKIHGQVDCRYHILVVLGAGIKQEGTKQWVKLATQKSAKIVVRGRGPSYFRKERGKFLHDEDENTSLSEPARASG